jgi:hypothetical protein
MTSALNLLCGGGAEEDLARASHRVVSVLTGGEMKYSDHRGINSSEGVGDRHFEIK